jgi:hypothetical protein
MARKSTPQPLTLADPTIVNDEHNFIDSPRSPLSPKSPRSPRSPFNFSSSSRKTQPKGEQPPMQAADSQQLRSTLPPSQTTPSLSTLQQTSGASGGQDNQERERPSRSGFFSNYKASKSSSRLQQNADTVKQAAEDKMSRDTDRAGIGGKVSSQEKPRSGTTLFFLSLTFRWHGRI